MERYDLDTEDVLSRCQSRRNGDVILQKAVRAVFGIQKDRKLTFPRLLSNFSTAQEPESPSWKILTQTLPSPFELAGARYATWGSVRDVRIYGNGSRTDWSFMRGSYDVISAVILV